jgi:hypothetical protein
VLPTLCSSRELHAQYSHLLDLRRRCGYHPCIMGYCSDRYCDCGGHNHHRYHLGVLLCLLCLPTLLSPGDCRKYYICTGELSAHTAAVWSTADDLHNLGISSADDCTACDCWIHGPVKDRIIVAFVIDSVKRQDKST